MVTLGLLSMNEIRITETIDNTVPPKIQHINTDLYICIDMYGGYR